MPNTLIQWGCCRPRLNLPWVHRHSHQGQSTIYIPESIQDCSALMFCALGFADYYERLGIYIYIYIYSRLHQVSYYFRITNLNPIANIHLRPCWMTTYKRDYSYHISLGYTQTRATYIFSYWTTYYILLTSPADPAITRTLKCRRYYATDNSPCNNNFVYLIMQGRKRVVSPNKLFPLVTYKYCGCWRLNVVRCLFGFLCHCEPHTLRSLVLVHSHLSSSPHLTLHFRLALHWFYAIYYCYRELSTIYSTSVSWCRSI